jgi:hypothetical protein
LQPKLILAPCGPGADEAVGDNANESNAQAGEHASPNVGARRRLVDILPHIAGTDGAVIAVMPNAIMIVWSIPSVISGSTMGSSTLNSR